MSNPLAIAGVTSALATLLNDRLSAQPLPPSLGNVKVSAIAPDLIETGAGKPGQLNLFMFQATPNPAWRNAGPPSRDGSGRRLANQPLALDLHYLLTAYGSQNFHAEMILGCAMQVLHETPILPRDKIESILEAQAESGGDDLSAAGLADQIEQIKISPAPLNTEELSRLWSAFQSRYRPSATYLVSVVLIESSQTARSPLPVLSRGPNDRGPRVQGGLTPPFPTLVAALPPDRQPALRLGEVLALQGLQLDGDRVTARFANRRRPKPRELPALPERTATELRVKLEPGASDAWAAGVYTVAVAVERAGVTRLSNALPVALAPSIRWKEPPGQPDVVPELDINVERRSKGSVTLTVACAPPVWPGQAASLLLGERELVAAPIAKQTDSLVFKGDDLAAGEYLVRLRVDGVESLLVDRSTTPPRFDPSQRLIIS